jgi:hypothetical protein
MFLCFRPQPLELTASDEMVALENIDVLQQNGFEIDVDTEASAGQGSKLKLTAQPVSKNTTFGMKGAVRWRIGDIFWRPCAHCISDLEEVIHLMRDRPKGEMVRCSKARAMFAMRACRKSVMVGMPLTQQQMTTVNPCLLLFRKVYSLIQSLILSGDTTYGNNGPTLELSPWPPHDAPPFGYQNFRFKTERSYRLGIFSVNPSDEELTSL